MNSASKGKKGKDAAKQPSESVRLLSSSYSPLHREGMVEKAAYYHAERRGFEPGHELEDWLAAERDIDDMLAGADPEDFSDYNYAGSEERPW